MGGLQYGAADGTGGRDGRRATHHIEELVGILIDHLILLRVGAERVPPHLIRPVRLVLARVEECAVARPRDVARSVPDRFLELRAALKILEAHVVRLVARPIDAVGKQLARGRGLDRLDVTLLGVPIRIGCEERHQGHSVDVEVQLHRIGRGPNLAAQVLSERLALDSTEPVFVTVARWYGMIVIIFLDVREHLRVKHLTK